MAAIWGLTQFEWDEEQDLKVYPLWIQVYHDIPMKTPLVKESWCHALTHSYQIACELLSMPTTKGWDWRIIDGWLYLATILLSEEEQRQREPIYRERLRPFIDDFDNEWGKCVSELMAIYKPLKDAEPLAKLSNVELLLHYDEFQRVYLRQWDIHFYVFYAIYPIYSMFEETCRELIGLEPQDPLFKRLMGGFENMLFTVNRELWRLGDRAKELGLADLFLTTEDNEQVIAKLEASEAGRSWLEEYRGFLNVHGWRTLYMFEWGSPSWIEKPSLAIPFIKQGIAKGGAFVVDQEREGMIKERQEAEREVLARAPADKRDWFEKLMKSAQKCSVWSEDHNYLLDMMSSALGRHVAIEYGRRFARAGVIDDPEDVCFLLRGEIEKAAIIMERVNLRRYVEQRKAEYQRFSRTSPQRFLGDMSALGVFAQKDPLIRVQANPPMVKPELKADLYGAGSAPGVAEGIARVILSEAELDQVQPGDILVAPVTFAPWTPVFGIVNGAVTDMGGDLCHAVIIAREYRIPAVSGTLEATTKIKTGQRIKIDGDNAAVYILG